MDNKRSTFTLGFACWLAFLTSLSAAPFKDVTYSITGVKGDILENIENKLAIFKKDLLANPNSKALNYYYNNLEKIIDSAVTPYGYYRAKIRIRYTNVNKTQQTSINIKLDKPTIIQRVKIDVRGAGKQEQNLKKLIKQSPLEIGTKFNSIEYESYKSKFNAWGADNGYIQAEFIESIVDVDRSNNTAVISLFFDTKERYFFGKRK